jgi:hypothetical protein
LVLARVSKGDGQAPGAPVIVAGGVGKGTVILDGFLSGYMQTELAPEEARLWAALVRYRFVKQP